MTITVQPQQPKRKPLLRSRDNAREIHSGTEDLIIQMHGCPDCHGRGWYCANPLAEFNRRFYQCPTCEDAKRHVDNHGVLPEDIAAALF